MTWLVAILAIVLLVVGVRVAALRIASSRAPVPELGVEDGRLSPCPETPNCVSSQAHPHDDAHYLAPLPFNGDPDAVVEIVDQVVLERPATERVERSGRYLRYTSKTYLMRSIDDVEFVVDARESVVHFRSASRIGGGDMGANRTRMRSVIGDVEEQLERAGLAADDAS